MAKDFSASFGSGMGFTLGIGVAAVLVVATLLAYDWLAEPVVPFSTKPRTVGTAVQAKVAALSALRKRGISDLAREVKAEFADNQWVVSGPAKSDAGKLVKVNVLLSVGTIDGVRHWKMEYMEIDGKEYVGK